MTCFTIYIAATRPLQYPTIVTKTTSKISVTLTWMIASIFGVLPFLTDTPDPYLWVCGVTNYDSTSVTVHRFVIIFTIPAILFLLCLFYIRIFLIARKHVLDSSDRRRSQNLDESNSSRSALIRTTTTTGLVLGAFTICWIPSTFEAVDGWMGVLLSKIKPFLYQNGGPIITVQVENEYGSFPACDYSYMRHLYQLFRSYLGDDIVLFTTDGAGKSYLKCGTLEDIYATVDFGPGTNVTKAFEAQREYEPKGPLVNSEFYTGWLDHWGQPHSVVSVDAVTKSLDQILSMGANVNMYMFEGGTNFGFWNGANGGGTTFNPQPTSYDYNAPLTESGDPTDKYFAIRDVISKHSLIPTGKDVVPVPKYAYGTIQMSLQATFYDVLDKMAPYGPINTTYPITMEQMQQYSGFMLYRTTIPFNVITPLYLNSTAIRDRGYVMINQIPQGMLTRIKNHSLSITALEGDTLDIFVESQGHLNYGPDLADPKGIFGNVTLNGTVLTQWSIFSLNFGGLMPNLRHVRKNVVKTKITTNLEQPSFYVGYLPDLSTINPPQDTFLKTSGWTKGQAYINGFNVGRYWPVKGPQVTLYVPASVLKPSPEKNVLLLFELEKAPCGPQETCSIEFIDRPIINGTVHNQFNTIHGRWKI